MLKYIVVIAFLLIFALFLFFMGKRAKQYNYQKEYAYCYNLILTNTKKAYKRLNSTIAKCEERNSNEFVCKFAILKLYADLDTGNKYTNSLRHIQIDELLCKDAAFDTSKAVRNGDSLYFLCLDIIKAHHHGYSNIMQRLHDEINIYAKELDKFLEFHLLNAIYASLTNTNNLGLPFYNDLLTNQKLNSTYDKNIMKIYQSTALAMKQYQKQPLSHEEAERLDAFSKTLLGKLLLTNLC